MNDNFSPEALWGQDPTAGGSRLPSGFVNVNGFVVFKCGATIDLPKFDSATGSITMEEILTDALIARCPGGHNACGYLHGGLTCRECSSTAGYDGETCSSCTDKPLRKFVLDNWLFSVMLLFLLTCVVLAVMYVITVGHEISSKASPAVFTGAFIGMTVQTFQTLAVFSSMKIAWPPEMQKIIASMRVVFLLELHEMGVGFECFAAASSFRHYLARIMMPFTVFSIYFGAYWLTRSREKARRRTQHGPEWSHTMHSLAERTQASLMARVSRFSLASFKSNMSALRFPGRLSLTSQASTVATGIYPGSGGGDAVPRSSTWAVAFQNRFAAGAKKVQKKLSTLSTRSKQRLSELRELKKAAPPDQVEAFRDDGELDDGAVLQADHSGNAARSASRPAKKMNHSVASQFKHNKTLSLMPAKAHTASDAAHKNGAGEAGARPASVRFAAPTAAGDVGACGSSRRLRSRASQIAESQGEHSRLRNRRAPVRISAGSNERASDATLLFQLRLTAMQNMYDRGSSKDSFITGFSTRSVKENAKVVWSRVKDEIVYEKVFCCCGFFAQAFYISFAALGFVPFVCFSHPTSGGRSTLRSMDQYEDVFCDWEDPEYLKFVAAAIFAILCWPVGLLSAAVYLIRVAPERSVSDPKFLAQTKFLFFRFRPERYYWSVVLACRSLLTVLSIVIGPDNPIYQMSWMFILLLSSLVLQLYCWPWKDESLNTIDTLLLFSLLVLTMFAFPMIQVSEGDRAFFEKIVMHLFFLFIVVMVLVFLYGVNLVFGAWHLRRMRRRMASILAEEQDKTMGLKEKTACVIVRGDSGEEEVADHDRDQNINNTSSDGHKKKHIISAPTSPTAAASFLARTAQNKIANLLSKPYAMYQTAGEKQREKIKTISSNWLTTQSAVTKMSSEKFTALVERLTYYELRALESVLQVMERHVQVERLSVSGGASGSLLTGKKCLGTGQRISLESEEADNEGSSEEDDDNEDTCSSDESSGGEAPAGEARARDAAGDLCVPRDRGSRSRIAGASRAGADVGAEGGGTRRTGHDVDKTKPADRPHTTGCLRSTLTMKAQQEEKEREIRAKHDHTTAVAELLLSSSSSHEKLKLQSTRSSSSRPRANMDANKIGHARSSARAHVHPDRPSDSIFVCAGSISSEGVFNAEQGTFGVSSASNEFGSSIRGEFGSSITMTNTSASRARLLLSSETTLSRAPGNQSSLEAHVSSVNTGATYPSRQTSSARSNSHELIVVLPGAVYPPMGENAASQISGQSSNALSGRVSLIGGQPSTTKTSSMSSVEGEQNHQIDRDGRLLPRAVKFESTASSSSAGGQSIASGAMADVSRGGAATGNGSSSEEVRKVHQMVSVKDQLVGGTNANSPQPSAGAVSEREQRAGSEQPAAQRYFRMLVTVTKDRENECQV
eukprot:g13323.t1